MSIATAAAAWAIAIIARLPAAAVAIDGVPKYPCHPVVFAKTTRSARLCPVSPERANVGGTRSGRRNRNGYARIGVHAKALGRALRIRGKDLLELHRRHVLAPLDSPYGR